MDRRPLLRLAALLTLLSLCGVENSRAAEHEHFRWESALVAHDHEMGGEHCAGGGRHVHPADRRHHKPCPACLLAAAPVTAPAPAASAGPPAPRAAAGTPRQPDATPWRPARRPTGRAPPEILPSSRSL